MFLTSGLRSLNSLKHPGCLILTNIICKVLNIGRDFIAFVAIAENHRQMRPMWFQLRSWTIFYKTLIIYKHFQYMPLTFVFPIFFPDQNGSFVRLPSR